MAKSYNQKGKILYLERILQSTGEDHTVSMQEILDELTKQGITAERKSIYDDMEVLRLFGMDIRYKRGKSGGYYLAGKANEQGAVNEQGTADEQGAANEQGTADGQCAVKEQGEAVPVRVIERTQSQKEEKQIKLLCEEGVLPQVQRWFGSQVQYKEKEFGYFIAVVQTAEDPEFYGWLTRMGKSVHIAKPKKAGQAYRDYLKSLAREYKGI